MSNFTWDQPDDSEETPLIKQLRAEIKRRDDRLKEQDETLKTLTGKVRTQSVADVLRELGAKPGLAKFAPESLETSREAVTSWLKDNEDLFGPVGQSDATAAVTEPQTPVSALPTTPVATPEQQAAFARMANADNGSSSLPDIESAQIAQLTAMADAAQGNPDRYFEYLRGDLKL